MKIKWVTKEEIEQREIERRRAEKEELKWDEERHHRNLVEKGVIITFYPSQWWGYLMEGGSKDIGMHDPFSGNRTNVPNGSSYAILRDLKYGGSIVKEV